jgi:hypothetical protein
MIKKSLYPGKNYARILFLFLGMSLVDACTKEVDFKPTSSPDEYVLNSLFTPGKEIQLFLNKTSGILDTSYSFGDASDIRIYENRTQIMPSVEKLKDRYIIHYLPLQGGNYKIEFNVPFSTKTIMAEDSIPSLVNIDSATYKFPVYTDQFETAFGNLKIVFNDEVNAANYYELILLSKDYSLEKTYHVDHPVISANTEKDQIVYPTLLFADEKFKDSKLVLNVFVASYQSPVVILRNVSYNYYKYKKNLYLHLFNQNTNREVVYDIFKGDPVDLYTNVNNGLGIFAAYSETIVNSEKLK